MSQIPERTPAEQQAQDMRNMMAVSLFITTIFIGIIYLIMGPLMEVSTYCILFGFFFVVGIWGAAKGKARAETGGGQ